MLEDQLISIMPLRADQISSFLGERIAAGDFPSAVYAVAARGSLLFADALGRAMVHESGSVPATLDTIYDLASLTKPLVTGLLCAQLVERGELRLDDPVALYLSEFGCVDKRPITLRHLLTHTSGLPAWRPLYLINQNDTESVLKAIANEMLEYEPGARVLYSDLGFIALGFLLEKITDMKTLALAESAVFQPLNLQRTFFNPPLELREQTAASESKGNLYEREMCGDDNRARAFKEWREDLIWGEVHDGNAHFLGGAAGHAGLFSTAFDTVRLAEQFIAARTMLLAPETCSLFRTNMTGGLNEARSFAWQLAETPLSTAGDDLPPASFGHTGFAGTSCWIDAARERVFILLTNRTHARSLPFANINAVRRRFHTLAVAALDSLSA